MKKIIAAVTGILLSISGGVLAESTSADIEKKQVIPIAKNVSPAYPQTALKKGLVGYVMLEFSVNDKGRVEGVEVVESSPGKVFDKAAIKALKRSRFDASTLSNEEIVDGQRKLYVFDIDQPSDSQFAKAR